MERFRFLVVDRFFAGASDMRRALERALSDKRDPFDRTRFAWEYWHVPGQFSQLRVPARALFGDALADRFEAALSRHLARELGAVALASPAWLSVMIDRHFQALHRDSPNGDFAFSFGLGREARYRGGETLIAKDELLDYFGQGAHRDGAAGDPLFDEVRSRFNRLVVFDARLPHAVREIEAPREPRDGRIAIQGWVRARARPLAGKKPKGGAGLVVVAAKKKVVLAHTVVATAPGVDVARVVRDAARSVRDKEGVVTIRL